jgi:hypothetical protein
VTSATGALTGPTGAGCGWRRRLAVLSNRWVDAWTRAADPGHHAAPELTARTIRFYQSVDVLPKPDRRSPGRRLQPTTGPATVRSNELNLVRISERTAPVVRDLVAYPPSLADALLATFLSLCRWREARIDRPNRVPPGTQRSRTPIDPSLFVKDLS